MNRIGKLMALMLGLWAGVAVAGTASSNEFKLDCRTGIRTAVVPEHIQYSTAWATNLTAAQQADAKAVVKVNPCLKAPPKYLVVDMSGGRSAARWPISYLDEVPDGGWTDEYKTAKLVLRYIPAGSFIMGGRATDYPGAVNTNLHMVTLTKPFYIGVFECTQRQWELAMGTRPSFFTNETCYATRPVEGVCYTDIRGGVNGMLWPEVREVDDGSFMKVLVDKTSFVGFDLPTEAQWEYACRAETTTALNNGLNITGEACPNVDMVSRNKMNSALQIASNVTTSNVDCASGTAKVGSYHSNNWGLYDMHGNVWEQNVDSFTLIELGAIDPFGNVTNSIYHQIKGGAYSCEMYMLAAGDHHENGRLHGNIYTWRANDVGFRICLHDATVYPSADSATVLVNASGAGAADWTPTQAGTYQLMHGVQVDGVTAGAMETALFRVEGPELCISALGELESGVQIEIKSKSEVEVEQWNVYYTLDGSEPTAESTLYEGPFALEESATVKAVAISEAGVRSDEARADFTLHDALSVVGAVARQRYPWNGMVDIDCEITGDSNCVYVVEVIATDLDGGTNLPVRTLSLHCPPPPLLSTSQTLPPGKYRFTWNADADIEGDFDFANVSVSVSAKGGPLVGYARQMTISVDGYTGSETLTNVPVLVRLSTAIDGFDYGDFASPSNGADMVFMDESETQVLPYEIDEWHMNGESLVWVKIPELNRGTKFMLAYGKTVDAESSPRQKDEAINSSERGGDTASTECMKHEVWREYAGVWHMNEDSGTAFDSTEHGLDALPDCGENGDVSQMVAYENGACGRARVNASANVGVKGNSLVIPAYDALVLGDTFSVSGWFHIDEMSGPQSLVSRKKSWTADDGWECVAIVNDDHNPALVARGRGTTNFAIPRPDMDADFVQVALVYQSNELKCYTNGVLSAEGAIGPATDNELPLSFGSNPGRSRSSLCGQYDEIRLRGGTLSADRIKADYDMIANKNFCTYLVVKE